MALFPLSRPKDPQDKKLYDYIHNILGFYPRNIALYRVAFTHKSMTGETIGRYHVSNERMEYLGDAVLSLAVADYLFHTYQPRFAQQVVAKAGLRCLHPPCPRYGQQRSLDGGQRL